MLCHSALGKMGRSSLYRTDPFLEKTMEDEEMDCWVEGNQSRCAKSVTEDWNNSEEQFLYRTRLFDNKRKKYVPKRKTYFKKEQALKRQRAETEDLESYAKIQLELDRIMDEICNAQVEEHKKFVKSFFNGTKRKRSDRGKFFMCVYCLKTYDFWHKHKKSCCNLPVVY